MRQLFTISFALALALALSASAAPARAAAIRRIFEPTDLELEKSGAVELDLQFGWIRGPSNHRVSVPDFELDIGLTKNLELDVDGTFSLEGPEGGAFSPRHFNRDNLWVGAKIGLVDWTDEESRQSFAFGLQVGPKLPVAPGSHGLGLEVLVLGGFHRGRTTVVLNAGFLADPLPDNAGTARPKGLEGGVDVNVDLPGSGKWSAIGELGGVRFLSKDPHQLVGTAGIAYAPWKLLTLSLLGLPGFLDGDDRYGILFGASPKVRF
jgi:hypothetical protein